MKHLQILGILCLGLVFVQPALASGSCPMWLDAKVGKMQKKLELTDDQANQLASALGEMKEQKEACREHESYTERRDCMREHKEAVDARIASVLTEKQQQSYQEWKEKRAEKRGHHRRKHKKKDHGGEA